MQSIKLRHGNNLSNLPENKKKRGRPLGSKKKEKLSMLKGYVPLGVKKQLKNELEKEDETESKLMREFVEMYIKIRNEIGEMIDDHGCSAVEVIKESLLGLIYDKSKEELNTIIKKLEGRRSG